MKQPVRPNGIRVLLTVVACLSAGIAFPATGALIAPVERAELVPGAVVLENFESYANDSFPEKWRVMKKDARTIYRIEAENGNRFLRARADKKTIQIGLEHPFDPKQQTHLTWRARKFPAGSSEKDRWFDEKINFYDNQG